MEEQESRALQEFAACTVVHFVIAPLDLSAVGRLGLFAIVQFAATADSVLVVRFAIALIAAHRVLRAAWDFDFAR